MDVFKEMQRVLKPGGLAIMSFSNRCFWTKAISIWTSTGDADHAWIVGAYFHYAGGFDPPEAVDISPNPGRTDPMYVVNARKKNIWTVTTWSTETITAWSTVMMHGRGIVDGDGK
ncbi:hypothetical protein QJS10_CPA06g01007 [Acorus calamus]|uniref:Methyltransferase type 11 domain-containing protein n=1 Tax=Acorus calamus TaxID=4465 RepID=A0AAV9ELK8_ACOCL|nr:hypothetical protein QJS10_CPA06g01007 [Acorus calamus]